MELIILNEQGNIITYIPLSAFYPSQEEIQSFLFYEDLNYKFKFILEEWQEETTQLLLFIDEKPVTVYYSSEDNSIQSELLRHFKNQYDLTNFSLKIEETYYYSDYYQIATKKQISKNIEKMIEEISNMQAGLLEICFNNYSRSRKASGIVKGAANNSISALIEIHRSIIFKLNSQYPYFKNNAKNIIAHNSKIVDINKAWQFGPNELLWISKHPEMLKECNYDTIIKLNNKNYIPEKIVSSIQQNSYDIYENQLILAFIKELVNSTLNINRYIQNELINKLKNSLRNPKELLDNYEIPSNLRVKLLITRYEKISNEITALTSDYEVLFSQYKSIFKDIRQVKFISPRFTPIFRNILHYRTIFEVMSLWWEDYRTYSFAGEEYMMRLKQLSKIYEYYCLLKLILGIKKIGYELNENFREDETVFDLVSGKYSAYHFINKNLDTKLTLYYEPKISGSLADNVEFNDLYVLKSRSSYLTPDYMLKFEYGGEIRYGILDAKHTYEKSVEQKYLPDTTLKYLHGIASVKNQISVLLMWLLYPHTNGYKEIAVQRPIINHNVYPSVGIFSVCPDVKEQDVTRFIYRIINNFHNYFNINTDKV
ncbi:MAG: nuclease domain-containing protein [Clostridiaceae bacterium]